MKVLVLTHQDYDPPDDVASMSEDEVSRAPWKTEYDVISAIERLGHQTHTLGAVTELPNIRNELLTWKPDVVFNLLEEFRGEGVYVPYVLGYFELMRQPFTGCNASGLLLCDDKTLMKKVLRYHRIPIPDFALFPRGRSVRRPKRLSYPLIVKSATMHGSVGISRASVVTSDEKLRERVEFIHEHLLTDALAEEYVDGREFYIGMLGNKRLDVLPLWEMYFDKREPGEVRIATSRVKWDQDYQKKKGITTGKARAIPEGMGERIDRLVRRVYRILGLSGYARMDLRLTDSGRLCLLEPNPNPDLAIDEDFSESAYSMGIEYDTVIRRILSLGMRYAR